MLLSLVMTTAHLVRTAVGVGRGDGFANILLALPGAVYLGICLLTGSRAELATLFGVDGGWRRARNHHPRRSPCAGRWRRDMCGVRERRGRRSNCSQWGGRSARLWLSNALEAANQYLDVLVIGYLVDPATAGAWFVLTRVANVISVATDAIHMFSTRHIPELYYRGRFAELSRILDTVAWVTLIVIFGSIAGIVVAGGLAAGDLQQRLCGLSRRADRAVDRRGRHGRGRAIVADPDADRSRGAVSCDHRWRRAAARGRLCRPDPDVRHRRRCCRRCAIGPGDDAAAPSRGQGLHRDRRLGPARGAVSARAGRCRRRSNRVNRLLRFPKLP